MTLAVVQATPKHFPTVKEMTGWVRDALSAKTHGETVTYAELTAICTIDATARRARAAVLRAGRLLLREHNKLVVNVRNVGYQIATPEEHAGESKRFQRASRRRLDRALAAAVHVNLAVMSPEARNLVLAEQVRCALKLGLDRKLSRRKTLPTREQIALPSGAQLVRMLTKR